jgi:hypothetical protein
VYDYSVEVIEAGASTTFFTAPVTALEVIIDAAPVTAEVLVEGPQGPPGQDKVLVLEAGVSTVPPGTAHGTIIFQKQ